MPAGNNSARLVDASGEISHEWEGEEALGKIWNLLFGHRDQTDTGGITVKQAAKKRQRPAVNWAGSAAELVAPWRCAACPMWRESCDGRILFA